MAKVEISELYEIQKVLDARIIKEKGLEGQDLLPNIILALQVEIGELANEWRGFKYWSKGQSPRKRYSGGCDLCDYWEVRDSDRRSLRPDGSECDCYNGLRPVNTVLEEYVDCLHFILSLGLQLDPNIAKECPSHFEIFRYTNSITEYFNLLFGAWNGIENREDKFEYYFWTLAVFLELGDMLGFTWEQIYQAYLDKNKVNHERQTNGY